MTKKEYLEVELLRLRTRQRSMRNYCLNSDMQISANVLDGEIELLELLLYREEKKRHK